MSRRCIVCGGGFDGRQHFASAWEASLGTHPCCSERCAGAFDPHTHWLPAVVPAELSDVDAAPFVANAQRRLRAGEEPNLVTRDLLLAGVVPWQVRRVVGGVAVRATQTRNARAPLNWLGALSTLVTGGGRFFGDTGDRVDVRKAAHSGSVVDEWEAHFGARMHDQETIRPQLRRWVLDHARAAPPAVFTDQLSILEAGLLNSLDIAEFVLFIEGLRGVELGTNQIEPELFTSIDTLWAAFFEPLRE